MASIGILIAIIVYLVMMVYVGFYFSKGEGKERKIQRTIFIWVEDSWDRL